VHAMAAPLSLVGHPSQGLKTFLAEVLLAAWPCVEVQPAHPVIPAGQSHDSLDTLALADHRQTGSDRALEFEFLDRGFLVRGPRVTVTVKSWI
jgi:hypothetical protein